MRLSNNSLALDVNQDSRLGGCPARVIASLAWRRRAALAAGRPVTSPVVCAGSARVFIFHDEYFFRFVDFST
jgi:hypothetical protein